MLSLLAGNFRPDARNTTSAAALGRLSHEKGLTIINKIVCGPSFAQGSLNMWLAKLGTSAENVRSFLGNGGEVTRSRAQEIMDAATFLTAVPNRFGHLMTPDQCHIVNGYTGLAVQGMLVSAIKGKLFGEDIIVTLAEMAAETTIQGWSKKDALDLLQSTVPLCLLGPVAVRWSVQLGNHTQAARKLNLRCLSTSELTGIWLS